MIDAESPEGKEVIIKELQKEKSHIMDQFATYQQKVAVRLREIQGITEELIRETDSI